jgi:hypothetical protein
MTDKSADHASKPAIDAVRWQRVGYGSRADAGCMWRQMPWNVRHLRRLHWEGPAGGPLAIGLATHDAQHRLSSGQWQARAPQNSG